MFEGIAAGKEEKELFRVMIWEWYGIYGGHHSLECEGIGQKSLETCQKGCWGAGGDREGCHSC